MFEPSAYFISCDWGTSAFRLKAVEAINGIIKAAFESDHGIKKVHAAFLAQTKLGQADYFTAFLVQQIKNFIQQIGWMEKPVKVVVSGMASSSIGLKELQYAELPFDLGGKGLVFESIPLPSIECEMILISGIKKPGDVMRGEEMQLIGLFHHAALEYNASNFVFPGTHTKYIQVKDFEMVDFQTHITGELYAVIQSHTILKSALQAPSVWDESMLSAFQAGVLDIQNKVLTQALFSIRARNLQGDLLKTEAASYLSGLLIGSELKALSQATTLFCCNTVFYPLYEAALKALGCFESHYFLPPTQVDNLVVQGHQVFLRRYF